MIGLPGDEITYRNKTLFINGKEIPQTISARTPARREPTNRMSRARR